MMKGILTAPAITLIIALILIASPAKASLTGFNAISNNSPVNTGFGEAQFFFEAGESTPFITFSFFNLGPEDSSIAEIFFDDSNLNLFDTSSVSGFFINSGVAFTGFVGNATFPYSDGYNWTTSFYYEAAPPPAYTGINPNEQITFSLLLMPGYNYDSVMAALNSGDLRIGVYAIGWANGAAESFINIHTVPAPGALLLVGSGLIGIAGLRRKLGGI